MLSSDFNIIVDSGGGINSWKLIVKFLEIEIGGINGCINHACNNVIFTERNLSGGARYLLKFTRLKRCDAFNLFTLLSQLRILSVFRIYQARNSLN